MLQSLKEYVVLLGKWLWMILMGIFVSAIGAYLTISGKGPVPIWVWLIVLGLTLLIAPFIAFHKIKLQRDDALRVSNNDVATRIITVDNYGYEFKKLDDGLRLMLDPEIHAIPGVRVEDMQLEMKGKRYDTSWEPMSESISGDFGERIYVNLPKSLKFGTYKSRIVAIIENIEYYSDFFDLNYQKTSLDNGGSQN